MDFLFLFALIAAIILWVKKTSAEKEIAKRDQTILQQSQRITDLEKQLSGLAKYQDIVDAHREARDILANARSKADAKFKAAGEEATRIIESAKQRAEEIAGEAYSAMNRAKEFADTAQAMKNIIEGYGDAYIVPSYSLLDDLADEFGYTEAGQKLKEARESSRVMVKTGMAATCDYAENNRKETAIRFVIDAFNGKVDSILSRSKADNYGKLEQEIRDAFALVNHNGTAFRNARITDQYQTSRLNELKWATTAYLLKEEEREEQRRLREQIREEEKARREFERAIKDAAKEEETIKKAMEKVQQQVAAANEAQRAEYEAKLHELEAKLKVAEEKNQRALSMAQQTRTGHVYVISNIGSFGEDVFKIGMTRRLDPIDRVRELGDASVPFEFDVHAMIYSEDAPTLEKKLHRHFLRQQINKVNPRKEFFRLGLSNIRREVESLGVETHWTMKADAQHYRESLRIEQQIRENPILEREWTRHQLEFEPTIEEEREVEPALQQ
jgi:cell division protein FtsL